MFAKKIRINLKRRIALHSHRDTRCLYMEANTVLKLKVEKGAMWEAEQEGTRPLTPSSPSTLINDRYIWNINVRKTASSICLRMCNDATAWLLKGYRVLWEVWKDLATGSDREYRHAVTFLRWSCHHLQYSLPLYPFLSIPLVFPVQIPKSIDVPTSTVCLQTCALCSGNFLTQPDKWHFP